VHLPPCSGRGRLELLREAKTQASNRRFYAQAPSGLLALPLSLECARISAGEEQGRHTLKEYSTPFQKYWWGKLGEMNGKSLHVRRTTTNTALLVALRAANRKPGSTKRSYFCCSAYLHFLASRGICWSRGITKSPLLTACFLTSAKCLPASRRCLVGTSEPAAAVRRS